MKNTLEKYGSFGSIMAGSPPICFSKLASIGTLLGLGALAPFEVYWYAAGSGCAGTL